MVDSDRVAQMEAPLAPPGRSWLPTQRTTLRVTREADSLIADEDGVILATLDLESGQLSVDLGAISRLEQLIQVSHALAGHPQTIAARRTWGGQSVGRLSLLDRNAFLATLEDRLIRTPEGAARTGAVALVDVDNLKYINDRMGHKAGDTVLDVVAQRLQGLAGDPTVARVGGDEFMILFDELTPHAAACLLATASCDAMGPVVTEGGELPVTVSAGVTDLYGSSVDEVLSRADVTMFQAKRAGRDQIRVFGEGTAVFIGERRDMFGTIEAIQASNKHWKRLAKTDGLTSLPNRQALDEQFALDDALRATSGRVDSVLFLDLDRFHSFNHARGQEAGDDALRTVAGLLRLNLRDGDTCFRRGGEEFIVVLPDTGRDDAHAVAERLRAAVAEAGVPHGGHPECPTLTITVVVGLAEPTDEAGAVVERAARVAFDFKEAGGRDCVLFLEPEE